MTILTLSTLSAFFISAVSVSAPPEMASQTSNKTLMLTLQFKQGDYTVLDAQIMNEKLPALYVNPQHTDLLEFNLKNLQGDILGQGKIVNPHVLRGVLHEYENSEPHGQQTLDDSTFVVRFPYVEGMHVLGVLQDSLQNGVQARSSSLPIPITRNILFSKHL
mgnify:CR=1 FL=1